MYSLEFLYKLINTTSLSDTSIEAPPISPLLDAGGVWSRRRRDMFLKSSWILVPLLLLLVGYVLCFSDLGYALEFYSLPVLCSSTRLKISSPTLLQRDTSGSDLLPDEVELWPPPLLNHLLTPLKVTSCVGFQF